MPAGFPDLEKFEYPDAPIPNFMAPLTSKQTACTATDQPVLRWYISDAWPGKMEFTLNESGAIEPVLEAEIDGPAGKGFWQINLADYNIRLKPGVEYEWFLVIVNDPMERSADFLASATMQYMEASRELKIELANAPETEHYHIYAKAGYWYDAMENISRMIDTLPQDRELKNRRAAMLKEIHLPPAAAFDREAI
ncbi:MAG: DUF928 domain-containing protein [Desulfobacterales bacterium]